MLYSLGLVSRGLKFRASPYRIGAYNLSNIDAHFVTRVPSRSIKEPFEGESREYVRCYHEASGVATKSSRVESLESKVGGPSDELG